MRRYETIFIVRPNVTEDDVEAVTSKATSIIEGDGGTIIRIDKWGLKKLAYLIKKESQGYYVYIDYGGIPASVSEMERIFRIDDKVLKYLTVKLADSCDPEAIKEELAIAESAAQASAEAEEKNEAAPAAPAESSVDDEKKDEAAPAESSAEDEKKEEEPSPTDEKQDD